MTPSSRGPRATALAVALTAALLAACATAPEAAGPARPETVVAVTEKAKLVRFNAGQPQRILQRKPLLGLEPGDRLIGIDIASGTLMVQGSREGVVPVVSPNTGALTAVGGYGGWGTGALDDASFDIADINNAAYAALRSAGRTRLYAVDLASGRATLIDSVGEGHALWGMAILP